MRIQDFSRLEKLGVALPVEIVEAIDKASDLLEDSRPPKPSKPAWDAPAEEIVAFLVADFRRANYTRNTTADQGKANRILLAAFNANMQSLVDAVCARLSQLAADGTYHIEDKATYEQLFKTMSGWIASYVTNLDIPAVRTVLSYDHRYKVYRDARTVVNRVSLNDIRTASLFFPQAPEGATLNSPVSYEDGLRLGECVVDLDAVEKAAHAFCADTAKELAGKHVEYQGKGIESLVQAHADGSTTAGRHLLQAKGR